MSEGSKVLGIVFSDMHDDRMGDLTMARTMGSVPYGGRYRLVDFALSNLVNAGVRNVGLVTKSNYHSLMDHVGSGREWDLARKIGGLTILPPFARAAAGIYRGSLEALNGISAYIRSSKADYVIISDCDLVANIDFGKFLRIHAENGAGITLLYGRYDVSAYGGDDLVLTIGEDGFLRDSVLTSDARGEQDAYLNVAVFDRELLLRLTADGVNHGKYSIYDILQEQAQARNVYCCPIESWFFRIHNMVDYFAANMALLDTGVRQELFYRGRPVLTKIRDQAPAKYGLSSSVKNSLVADGCIIDGTVENSVIFRGVKIGQGAVVRNSIVMQDSVVDENAQLDYVILDKDVLIRDGRRLAGYLTYPLYVPKKSHI